VRQAGAECARGVTRRVAALLPTTQLLLPSAGPPSALLGHHNTCRSRRHKQEPEILQSLCTGRLRSSGFDPRQAPFSTPPRPSNPFRGHSCSRRTQFREDAYSHIPYPPMYIHAMRFSASFAKKTRRALALCYTPEGRGFESR
jgi:hypothetical protein